MSSTNIRNDRRHTPSSKKPDKSDTRTPAQKDRDRLVYTSALRRLAQITQVLAADTAHVFHNRLTHSMQAAQVGRRLAERLLTLYPDVASRNQLDPERVEAACLAHDLGHPPFGHVAEGALNELAADIGGFEGNAQSFRIVTKLAQHSPNHRGLDLTRATLAAILKYPWLRGENPQKPEKWGAYETERTDFEFAKALNPTSKEKTLEANVMDWADDITYSVHDVDDFYRAGRIPLHLLADRRYSSERDRFFGAVQARHPKKEGIWSDHPALQEAFNQVIIPFFPLEAPYRGSWQERAFLREFTSQLIGRYVGATSVVFKNDHCMMQIDKSRELEVAMLKELTWVYVIESPGVASQQAGQREVIRGLFRLYWEAAKSSKTVHLFPPFYRHAIEESSDDAARKRVVVDLIAGMTEAQAVAAFNRLSGIALGSGLEQLMS